MPESYFYRDGAAGESRCFTVFPEALGERFHFLYYHPRYVETIAELKSHMETIELSQVVREPIRRGVQPEYVEFGERIVLKTVDLKNGWIDHQGALRISGEFFAANESAQVHRGDILITSTGFGSMGKVDVYELDEPALVDGHIAIVRLNKTYDPYFLCYFLRSRFGAVQFERCFTGSSGQIELQPGDLAHFVVPSSEPNGIPVEHQRHIAQEISRQLNRARALERQAAEKRDQAQIDYERRLSKTP